MAGAAVALVNVVPLLIGPHPRLGVRRAGREMLEEARAYNSLEELDREPKPVCRVS
jgi:hypothetical protein